MEDLGGITKGGNFVWCGGLEKKKTENVKRVIIEGSRQKEGAEPAEAGVPSTALESAPFIVAPQTFSSQVSLRLRRRRRQTPDARRGASFILRDQNAAVVSGPSGTRRRGAKIKEQKSNANLFLATPPKQATSEPLPLLG